MITLEIQRRQGHSKASTRRLHPRSPRQCYSLALRLLKRAGVLRCQCRNGGFVTEIDRNGYRTVRDLSIGIGE